MRLRAVLATRDMMSKKALFTLFADNDEVAFEKINRAFMEGERNWNQHLIDVFGRKEATQIADLLDKNV